MSVPLRLALILTAAAAWLVPANHRATWRAQWRADLWHYAAWLAGQHPTRPAYRARRLLARTLGCLPHACMLRLDDWRPTMLTHDLRYAWRTIIRRPGFSLTAVLIVALGIGANATIFSWVETVLLRPLPGVDASSLVALHGRTAARDDLSFSYPNFQDLRAARAEGLEDVFAFRGVAINLRAGDEPRRIWGQLVSPNFFDALRVEPMLGRGFVGVGRAAHR